MTTPTSPERDSPTPLPSQPSPRKRKVMVSSTARDLPDHRPHVLDACLRQSFDPIMMEHLSALDADAIRASLDMVDEADIYLGIFAYRYGWVPGFDNQQQISVTEMEYRRAVERGIPRLIFFMHDDHPVRGGDVETGDGAAKLKKLKDEIGSQRVAGFFKSPQELRALVIDSLSKLPKSDAEQKRQTEFHYVSPIPPAPEVYVAHPYTLLTAPGGLVGRRPELNWLTDWVAGTRHAADSLGVSNQAAMNRIVSRLHASRLFFFVAIGGQGKSALAWHWFQKIADQEMRPLAGRMWWSFYESDASFENFVIRALAYTAKISIEQAKAQPMAEREASLLHLLDMQPFLIVLDGLERLLLAYSGGNVRGLEDSELDQRTAHRVAEAYGLDKTAAQSFTGQARLRQASDPRVASFLRKLTYVRAARVLATTRLYPSDLQIDALGEPVASCFADFLPGLSDDDALELWRSFGARGARENVLPVLTSFEKHSLLVQALASEVARDRSARGDFEKWRAEHPDFNPFGLAHDQRRSHVLSHALRGLSDSHIWLLQTIAAFRMPTTYETLKDLACRMGTPARPSSRKKSTRKRGAKDETQEATGKSAHPLFDQASLDAALTELEDRGLVGWDRAANRYDLHPIVRGVVWNSLSQERRREVCETLQSHFQPIEVPNYLNVTCLEDLTPAIELFHALIELGRFDDAGIVFRDRLDHATLWRLSASRLRIELVERLFPDGTDQFPQLRTSNAQSYVLNALALAYHYSGQPGAAVPLFRRKCDLDEQADNRLELHVGYYNLSNAEQQSGAVQAAEASARFALQIARELGDVQREASSLLLLGSALSVHCSRVAESRVKHDALTVMEAAQPLYEQQRRQQSVGLAFAYRAEATLRCGDTATARMLADRAWELAAVHKLEADFIRAARLQGTAALRCSGGSPESEQVSRPLYEVAHERLHHALTRARACDRVEEELPTLIALAELHEALARGIGFQPVISPSAVTAREELEQKDQERQAGSLSHGSGTLGSPLGRREPESLTTSLQLTPTEHLDQAERLLDDVWDRAERGPYPLFQADAFNRLASLERTRAALLPADSAERTAALDRAGKAALRAYEKAWLDGPPFAYAYGLSHATAHLADLGLTPPDLPPYDDSKFPPMPDEPVLRKEKV